MSAGEGRRHDIGLIAEEVGGVIPEVVAYEENGKDAKSVDYARLPVPDSLGRGLALLIEGMKEQQREIEALKAAVASPSTSSGQALEYLVTECCPQ